MTHIAVVTTTDTQTEAQAIARALVERQIVACAQISEIESFYPWEGKVQNDQEYRILCKTTATQYSAVERAILELHSYELPAIHAFALARVHTAYGAWIDANSRGAAPA